MKKLILTLFSVATYFLQIQTLSAQVALNFNGISNSVTTSAAPVLNNQARTVDAWINTTTTVTTQKVICDWGAMSPNANRFTLNMINHRLRIEVGGVGIIGTTTLNTGQWFHVTAVYQPSITSGPNVFLYINGALELSGNFTGYPTLSTSSLGGFQIGARLDGINFFEGSIDEVKVYNYARTQAQIIADTLEYCTPQPGLVAYYKLNEGIPNAINTGSTTAIDYSGNTNNGTLNSFTLAGTSSNWVPGRVSSGAPTITANPSSNICSGATVSLSSNAATNFTWSTGNTTSTLITLSPSVTTSYSIAATSSLNCTTTSTITITVSTAAPNVTIATSQNPICLGASTGFTATGAVTYTWTGGVVNSQTFSPTSTTSYTLGAGNACGTTFAVRTITVNPLPITTMANPLVVCEGYTCNLTASALATSFSWSPGTLTGSNVIVNPLSPTLYTVSATDGTCFGTQTVQVATKPTPSISINNTFVTICEGESVILSASGAGTSGSYLWSPGGIGNATVAANPTLSTIYTVVGTNSLGCAASAQVPIVVSPKPNFSAVASNTLICNGESVTLNVSGANSYTWSSGATTSSITVTPSLSINYYSVTAAASGNSCTALQTITVAVITPSVNYTASISICKGNNTTLTANGATTYTWNNISSPSGQIVVSPTITSTYTLNTTTQSLTTNCLSSYVSTVIVNANPSITIIADKTVTICRGQSNTLTASGANSYTWSEINLNTAQIVVSPSINTTYTVEGTSAAGCKNSSQYLVKVSNCSGINDNNSISSILIYPNPAQDILIIKSESDITLKLFNAQGQFIKSIYVVGGAAQIDVSDLNRGLYQVLSENKEHVRLKFILN